MEPFIHMSGDAYRLTRPHQKVSPFIARASSYNDTGIVRGATLIEDFYLSSSFLCATNFIVLSLS